MYKYALSKLVNYIIIQKSGGFVQVGDAPTGGLKEVKLKNAGAFFLTLCYLSPAAYRAALLI